MPSSARKAPFGQHSQTGPAGSAPRAADETDRQRTCTSFTPDEHSDRHLAQAAYEAWDGLPTADIVGAVDSARLTAVRVAGTGEDLPARTAAATASVAADIQRQGIPADADGGADWTQFGQVVPVLSASAGAGASTVAALLADALQTVGKRVLLVDAADPARSGLAAAARSDGPVLGGPHPAVRIRASWRAQAVLARIETTLPVITPGMVPPPRFFAPANQSVDVSVVDIGHDPWRVGAHPLAGAGAWLRTGSPRPVPVLVCRATRPSLLHAEQVLDRLAPWNQAGVISAPAQLIVLGAFKWPAGVRGAAGRRTAPLTEHAVFVPNDPGLAASGITADETPARLRKAITPALQHLSLLPRARSANGACSVRKAAR